MKICIHSVIYLVSVKVFPISVCPFPRLFPLRAGLGSLFIRKGLHRSNGAIGEFFLSGEEWVVGEAQKMFLYEPFMDMIHA